MKSTPTTAKSNIDVTEMKADMKQIQTNDTLIVVNSPSLRQNRESGFWGYTSRNKSYKKEIAGLPKSRMGSGNPAIFVHQTAWESATSALQEQVEVATGWVLQEEASEHLPALELPQLSAYLPLVERVELELVP